MRFYLHFLWLILMALCSLSLAGCATSRTTLANIENPGPDLANFPNSAFTLPQGQAYIEISPATYNGKAAGVPQQYNAGYLLRYGLTDAFELRLLSSGFILQYGKEKNQTGIGPAIFDIKWHVLDADPGSFLPAMGIEASVQSTWGTGAFNSGTQPALSLNFDQALPYDIDAEYNIGFIGIQDGEGKNIYQLALAWALQRNITDPVAVFVNGYINTASGLTTSAIGGGAQWTLNERIAVFANVSAGLTVSTPSIYSLFGFAVAF